MVIAACQMRREDKRKPAGGALGGNTADARTAACAGKPLSKGLTMARAETRGADGSKSPRWKAHHEQTRRALLDCSRDGGCRSLQEKISIVNLVHGDVVLRLIARVGSRAELSADSHLGRESNDGNAYSVRDETAYRLVYVPRVAGQQSTIYYEHLSSPV